MDGPDVNIGCVTVGKILLHSEFGKANYETRTRLRKGAMKKLLGLITTLALASVLYAGEFPDISIKELKNLIEDKKVTLIDVNGSETYQKGHIPGAIDFEANSENFAKVLPKDKDALIVAYCGGPKCMAYKEAARAAEKLGYKNVKHLSAGIAGWKQAGEKTEKKSS